MEHWYGRKGDYIPDFHLQPNYAKKFIEIYIKEIKAKTESFPSPS